jgi:hypothetical protein
MQQIPEAFSAESGEGMLDLNGAAKTKYVRGGVRTGDSLPAGIVAPLIFERLSCVSLVGGHRDFSLSRSAGKPRCPVQVQRSAIVRDGGWSVKRIVFITMIDNFYQYD